MNTLEKYSDAELMEAFLTRNFSGVGGEFVDDVITTLKEYAFAGITDLDTLSVPNITVIPAGAFYKTEVSTSATIPWAKITSIGNCAFYKSSVIKESSISLPLVEEIDYGAFAGLNGLTSVTAPSWRLVYQGIGPEQDSPGIFEGSGLQSISAAIIDSTALGTNCFKDCASLTNVSLPEQTSGGASMFQGCTSLASISLPKLTSITASSMFQGCTALTTVSFPLLNTLTGMSTFYGCTALENISLPEVTGTLASSAFMDCSALKTVSLPKVTALGTTSFYGCSALTSAGLNIPLVTNIGSNCFFQCTALTTFIHDKVTTVQGQAFSYCTNMVTVELPVCNSIGSGAFLSCTKMKKCLLGGEITAVPGTAFQRCQALEALILSSVTAVPTLTSTAFNNATKINNGTGVIYVPDALVSNFEADATWGQYTIQGVSTYEEE